MNVARNRLIDLENCTDEEIDHIERQFRALKRREERGKSSTGMDLEKPALRPRANYDCVAVRHRP
jgi:hypothetical protein